MEDTLKKILEISALDLMLQYAWWILKIYLLYICFRLLFAFSQSFFVYRIAPLFYRPRLDQYKSRWTVITGGTDGIGKAYTCELARNQFKKFVLIGRNPTKLDSVRKHLVETYGVEVRTFIFDFEKGSYDDLRDFINSIDDIGFVLNSVGTGREKMERFGENPKADNLIFKVNGFGTAQFLSMVLEPMRRNGGGQIVCVSSCLGFNPVKNLAAYSSTKSFISFLCYCIDREYDNISVQILTPAVVATAMTYYKEDLAGSSLFDRLFVVTPSQLAKEAIRTIGLVRCTSGTFVHELETMLQYFPWFIQETVLDYIVRREDRRVLRLLEAEKLPKKANGSNGVAS